MLKRIIYNIIYTISVYTKPAVNVEKVLFFCQIIYFQQISNLYLGSDLLKDLEKVSRSKDLVFSSII